MFCEWYHQYSIQMYTGRSIFFIKSQTFKWNRSSEHGGALNGPRAQFEPRKSSARCLWICVHRKMLGGGRRPRLPFTELPGVSFKPDQDTALAEGCQVHET